MAKKWPSEEPPVEKKPVVASYTEFSHLRGYVVVKASSDEVLLGDGTKLIAKGDMICIKS